MIDIVHFMGRLASKRKIFHSEADFQHAFAWEMQSCLDGAEIRLERPIRANGGQSLHLDLLIRTSSGSLAIELKYKTTKLSVDVESEDEREEFRLASHGAQDIAESSM